MIIHFTINTRLTWENNQLASNDGQIASPPLVKHQTLEYFYGSRPKNALAHGNLRRANVEPDQMFQFRIDAQSSTSRLVQIAKGLEELFLH